MKRFIERKEECNTDTQYKVMLSGYHWCTEQLRNIAGYIILDAACGTGYGSFYLAQKALKVSGIDRDEDAIKFARSRYKKSNLRYLQMDCTKLGFSDHTFDAIISQDTIEHIQDDKKFLSEVRRVLKSQGTFIVFTPYSQQHTEKPDNIYHLREYSKGTFEELLTNYFSDIKFYGRRLSPELAKLERDLNEVRRYDKFGIRRIIPRGIRHLLGNLLAKVKRDITLKDVSCHHIEYFDGVEGTSTLIAICKNG